MIEDARRQIIEAVAAVGSMPADADVSDIRSVLWFVVDQPPTPLARPTDRGPITDEEVSMYRQLRRELRP